jgi:sulfite exporter TauE/SafE/copper chaperone CopZ
MSNKKYLNVFIKGLHCRSCELLIEEKFKDIKHVQEVQVNYKTGEAAIAYTDSAPDVRLINQAIIDAGYEVGAPDKLPLLTKDKREYVNLGIAFLILMILYLSLKGLGLTNINLTPDLSNPSWGLIIVIGLVAGFSTCMAMVGGLSLGLSTKFVENHPQATPTEKFRPHLFFIFGRILAYAWLGGILGVLGMAIKLSTTASGFITVFVGLIMLLMGLQLINIFPRLNRFKLSLPKGISKALGIHRQEKEYTHKQAMVLGALTFFLPCGFTQAMQLYAISTGNFALGALVMGLFAIGTAPGLLSIGGVTSLVKGNIKERFFKVAGLAVIFFGLFNLSNGYTLASLSFDGFGNGQTKTKNATVIDPNVTMENGVQIVRMVESTRGYSPNSFSVKKGVPVKWIIDAQAQYSCASALIVPKLGIQKNLTLGENIIEFTPQEVGKLPFSCSMGMYTGVFNVYEDNNTGLINSALAAVAEPAPVVATGNSCGLSSGGCGCGGGGGN